MPLKFRGVAGREKEAKKDQIMSAQINILDKIQLLPAPPVWDYKLEDISQCIIFVKIAVRLAPFLLQQKAFTEVPCDIDRFLPGASSFPRDSAKKIEPSSAIDVDRGG